jgi:hypothetical protein
MDRPSPVRQLRRKGNKRAGNWRLMRSIAFVLVLLLAGCAGNSSPDSADVHLANEARAALGNDAQLYLLMGVEPLEDIPAEGSCPTIPRDASHGDGVAPLWGHMYAAGETAVIYAKDGQGNLLCSEQIDMGEAIPAEMAPLSKWRLNSRDAAGIINTNVPDFLQLAAAADVFMGLAQSPDGPVWAFALMDDEVRAWSVHADRGDFEVLNLDEFGVETPTEAGTASGSVVGTPLVYLPTPAQFNLNLDGHAVLELVLQSDEPAATLGLSYTVIVEGPGGRESFEATNGQVLAIEAPQAGEYTVEVQPAVAGAVDFEVAYCAYSLLHCQDAPTAATVGKSILLGLARA